MSEPDIFFIVPYRDREAQLELFMNQNKIILDGLNYQILISHQCDRRPFNRGALKNLGFLYIRKKYPKTYKDKTLVFSDVDCVFWKKGILKWKTTHGRIKHFYGTNPKKSTALGGLFSITAGDFERLNGFPNYWAWGYEDNALWFRVKFKGINIDYSQFHGMGSKWIIVFWHGPNRDVAEVDSWKRYKPEMEKKHGYGLSHIKNIKQELLKITDRIFYLQNISFNVPEKIPKNIIKKMPNMNFKDSERKEGYKNIFKHSIKIV
tara:strand:- start:7673 stop:8461 length:789 start_codon:yes stop_codon:yes gene_type:complete